MCANGAVTLIVLILVLILAWNYLKLLLMNAWCLKLFVSMVGAFIANPLLL